jgi:hypothetical protein
MNSGLGNDHSAVAVADQHARPGPVQHQPRSRDIGLEGGLGLLNDEHPVAIMLQNIRDRLPSGTVGECAVDQNDILDCRLAGGGEPHTEQCKESKR